MNDKLSTLFSQPSTWRGITMLLGGIATAICPAFIAAIVPATMVITGLIGSVTNDAKSTPSTTDDILSAAANGVQEAIQEKQSN